MTFIPRLIKNPVSRLLQCYRGYRAGCFSVTMVIEWGSCMWGIFDQSVLNGLKARRGDEGSPDRKWPQTVKLTCSAWSFTIIMKLKFLHSKSKVMNQELTLLAAADNEKHNFLTKSDGANNWCWDSSPCRGVNYLFITDITHCVLSKMTSLSLGWRKSMHRPITLEGCYDYTYL